MDLLVYASEGVWHFFTPLDRADGAKTGEMTYQKAVRSKSRGV